MSIYLFRGDNDYRGGPIGLPLGPIADAAEIQSFEQHVLRKAYGISSRFVSFTTELKVARSFTARNDNRYVVKVLDFDLRTLEEGGTIRVWSPEAVFVAMRQRDRKVARQAADVRAAMIRNSEVLIEGEIPPEVVHRTL